MTQNNPLNPPNRNPRNYSNAASNQFNQGSTDNNPRVSFGGSYRNNTTSQNQTTGSSTNPNNHNMSSDGKFEEINLISTEADIHETLTAYVNHVQPNVGSSKQKAKLWQQLFTKLSSAYKL